MAAEPPPPPGASAIDNTMLHVIYGLFALSFLLGFASIAAVVIAYLQRGKPLFHMQISHVEWQIRTFWWGLLFAVIGVVASFVFGLWLAIPFIWAAAGAWYVYRIAKGWLWLKDGRPIDDPTALI